jgi:hypothetical protein
MDIREKKATYINVRMTHAEKDAAKRLAKHTGCSLAELVRRAVGMWTGRGMRTDFPPPEDE